MSIAVFGVNHRTAPLEVRERFAHAAREVPGSLERVLAAGARGGVLLSTCNRTEFYLTEPGDTVREMVWALLAERLVEGRGAHEYGYAHRDRDAVRHLYRVSSGLDSMLLGESQIQGQVREAWEISKGQAGPRSEEHTSELQSQSNLVCRLLLEKKKKKHDKTQHTYT